MNPLIHLQSCTNGSSLATQHRNQTASRSAAVSSTISQQTQNDPGCQNTAISVMKLLPHQEITSTSDSHSILRRK